MTTESNELFELCRRVYEATGWGVPSMPCWIGSATEKHAQQGYPKVTNYVGIRGKWEYGKQYGLYIMYPLYTSDYLLEKLPVGTNISKTNTNTTEPSIYYSATCRNNNIHQGDTPLKALLKLCLTLHKEGVL